MRITLGVSALLLLTASAWAEDAPKVHDQGNAALSENRDAISQQELKDTFNCFEKVAKGEEPRGGRFDQFVIVPPESLKIENGSLTGILIRIRSGHPFTLTHETFSIANVPKNAAMKLEAIGSEGDGDKFANFILKQIGGGKRNTITRSKEQVASPSEQAKHVGMFKDWLARGVVGKGFVPDGCPKDVVERYNAYKAKPKRDRAHSDKISTSTPEPRDGESINAYFMRVPSK